MKKIIIGALIILGLFAVYSVSAFVSKKTGFLSGQYNPSGTWTNGSTTVPVACTRILSANSARNKAYISVSGTYSMFLFYNSTSTGMTSVGVRLSGIGNTTSSGNIPWVVDGEERNGEVWGCAITATTTVAWMEQ